MSEKIEEIQDIYDQYPRLKQEVSYLKVWLVKQKHLPAVSDLQLVTFLNSCNNSLEATKSCIDAYFTMKCNATELFGRRDPLGEDIQKISQVAAITALSSKSPEGYRYIFGRLSDQDVSKYQPDVATKLLFMVMDATLRYNATAPGIVVVYDMKGVQFQHIAKASPSTLKKYMLYVQEGMPVKMKEMHIINVNPIISKIMLLLRPLMSKEHHQLLNFHTTENMAEFHKHVPLKCMPKDYGGDDDTVEELTRKTRVLLESYRSWFLEDEERCRVDETKREVKTRQDGDFFGQDGSFKKLTLD